MHIPPPQGVGGTVQYPKGFLKKVYEIVREKGGLCIADEVRTYCSVGMVEPLYKGHCLLS